MVESGKLVIRDKVINKIFDKVNDFIRKELLNPKIKPGVTFEEQKIILGRLDDIFLQQKMELYCTYFFDENIKPIFEKQLQLIQDMIGMPKKEKPKDPTYVQ